MDRSAHATMLLRPTITPVSLQLWSAWGVNILGCSCSTVQVRTARWTNVKTNTKPSKSKSDYMKSLAKVIQDVIPVSTFDKDQVNHALDTLKELKESTPKTGWRGGTTSAVHHQAHLRQWWQPSSWWQSSSWWQAPKLGWTDDCSLSQSQCQGVSLTGNGDSLASDGRCKHNTKTAHASHSLARDFFSRGLKTWVIESTGIVVSRKN